MQQNITIVGGGLVGSLLSIYLAKKNHKVTVYERRPNMRDRAVDGGRSINLALSSRGWQALEEVGIADRIKELAIPMEGRMIHQDNGQVQFQAYGQKGEAIYSVSRGALNNELDKLSDSHDNVTYQYETRCSELDLSSGMLYFDTEEGILSVKPDVIFGADGAFSKVRRALQFKKRFNYSQEFLPHAYKELSIPANEDGSWKLDKNALHIWPRRSFMLIALPNLDGSFTCTLFLAFEGEDAFENLKDEKSVIKFFGREFPDALPLMPTLVEDFFENPTDTLVTVRCNPWNKENVCLIGDASHAIVPFYGQGMNSGFEDCRVLNELVNKYETKPEGLNWNELLEEYSQLRVPDTNAIADLALKNFVEMRDDVADQSFLLRKKIEKHLQANHPDEFTPAYALVTFTPDVRYSEALRRGKIQDELFAKLFEIENISEKWENNDLESELNQFLADYKTAIQ
ncbi:UNVERIFIED_CONTAM: hypothetical protein GTU68_007407 [Idotea baltica]|nr:hypothetical protein [Idotea baltica]